MSESASLSKFFASHKAAIAITAIVGVGSAAGLYFLYQQQAATATKQDESHKKKSKSKAKKAKKATVYPVNSETGLPEIGEALVATLSDEDKDQWALALKEAGNELFKSKKFEDAIAFYSSALLCKIDPVFYANRSACYAAMEENQKAIEDTTEALKINPSYAKCLLRRATAYENIEDYSNALFDLSALSIYGADINDRSKEAILERVLQKQATKINQTEYLNLPKELPSTSSLSSFFGAFSDETIDLNEDLYEEGSGKKFLVKALISIKKDTTEAYAAADVLFNQAVEKFASIPESELSDEDKEYAAIAYEYYGTMLFLKMESEEAIANVKKAISLFPTRSRSHIILGLLYADKGDQTAAFDEFNSVIKSDPENKDIYYHSGQVYYLIADLEKAQQNFEKAKQYNPKNPFSYIQLACIAYKQGDSAKCDKLFADAKKLFPVAPEIPNYYGEILFDRRDVAAAAKQFDIAIRLQAARPTSSIGALPLVNRAMVYQTQGMLDECVAALTQAVELDPKSETAKLQLGQLYLYLQKAEEGVALIKDACLLSRTSEERIQAISLLEMGKIQLRIKEDKKLSAKMKEMYDAQNAQAYQAAFAQAQAEAAQAGAQ